MREMSGRDYKERPVYRTFELVAGPPEHATQGHFYVMVLGLFTHTVLEAISRSLS